ncbi:MAG: nucleotidyltransferase domain-containing protein [Lachnospiraceae bacterium]|nr:nucleotidyltransferase domain-containing protein [Lachnospiraceae bacterium]
MMKDYYSVSEYAKITGKDPGNIRRNLINGTLKGEKLGNQWCIPKDTVYPKDKRIKNGNYVNWRRLLKIKRSYPDLMVAIECMCNDLTGIYGSLMDRVILYGSYARGEETSESDVDIALVLNGEDVEEKHEAMNEIIIDYELDQGVTLSVIAVDKKEYDDWNDVIPFYKNITKEGILLWKTA